MLILYFWNILNSFLDQNTELQGKYQNYKENN